MNFTISSLVILVNTFWSISEYTTGILSSSSSSPADQQHSYEAFIDEPTLRRSKWTGEKPSLDRNESPLWLGLSSSSSLEDPEYHPSVVGGADVLMLDGERRSL